MITCKNCGYKTEGNYCSFCGQRLVIEDITFKSVFKDSISSLISIEKPFFVTFKQVLINPEIVISEYVKGKRVKYQNPIKFFLLFYSVSSILKAIMGKEERVVLSWGENMILFCSISILFFLLSNKGKKKLIESFIGSLYVGGILFSIISLFSIFTKIIITYCSNDIFLITTFILTFAIIFFYLSRVIMKTFSLNFFVALIYSFITISSMFILINYLEKIVV